MNNKFLKTKLMCPNCKEKITKENYCKNCGTKIEHEERKPKEKIIINISKTSFKKLNNKYILIPLSIFITLIISFFLTATFYDFYLKDKIKETTKIEKDITITDKGIADSVSKVYDSVVVVENYRNNNLYSTGTGFVFKEDDNSAYILTNHHVIENNTDIYVIFTNNKKEKVTLVGSDEYSDIAVLKIDKDKILAISEIGSSEDLRVGDTTFAVGAPLDSSIYSWTVTRGILSGKNRIVEVSSNSSRSSNIMEVLQTDTAINSGNSGGPLCNSNGEVIGITNMKISSTSVEGIGFAIPIETAIEYANMFIEKTPIVRPYLGVSMYDLGNNFFTNETGVYIESVEANSPAEKFGLQKGDIIIKFNDQDITSSAYLKYMLYKCNIGDEITITYKRNNKNETVKVILGSYNITT